MNRKLKLWELERVSEEQFKSQDKFPVIVILDDLRSFNNIGSFFRTSDAFNVEKVYLCGITATPPHRDIQRTALGATETVVWEYRRSIVELIVELKQAGVTVCSIEQAEKTIFLQEIGQLQGEQFALVFGNEVDGVNQTPLGEPLSPITNPLSEAVNTDLGLDTLISALPNVDPTDGGLVTSVVDLADGITQPISEQVDPYDQLLQGLRDVAVEIDNVLEGVLSQMGTEVPNLDSLGGGTPALPAEVEGGLADLVDGILGGADTLQSALEGAGSGSGLPEIPEGDLLGTLSSGISSGADALGGELGGLPGLPTDGLPG